MVGAAPLGYLAFSAMVDPGAVTTLVDSFVKPHMDRYLKRINDELGTNESLIGPMFYHMGEHRHGSSLMFNGIHQEMVNNKIDAFSKAFLATTVACARCVAA